MAASKGFKIYTQSDKGSYPSPVVKVNFMHVDQRGNMMMKKLNRVKLRNKDIVYFPDHEIYGVVYYTEDVSVVKIRLLRRDVEFAKGSVDVELVALGCTQGIERVYAALMLGKAYIKKIGSKPRRLARVNDSNRRKAVVEDETLNVSQRDAIKMLIDSSSVSLIHGPPGTGKTHTIYSGIHFAISRQIYRKILMTAPSNQAICEVLLWFLLIVGCFEVDSV